MPACHNAEDTVTVSGPAQAVHDFVVQLKEEGYFAREVSSNGVAFHSYYMAAIAPKLKQCLEKVSHALSSHKLQNPLLYSMSMVIRNCLRLYCFLDLDVQKYNSLIMYVLLRIQVITPKPRGKRWISTSIEADSWGTQLHSMSSADYHVNNLVSPVLFQV